MSTKVSRRTKKTVPKTILNLTPARSTEEEEEEEVEGEEEQNKATDRGATVDDNEDAILLESSDNYRRFSSRVRRKTEFYVSTPGDENDDGEMVIEHQARRKSGARVPPAVRKLVFVPYQPPKSPLVAAAPDVLVGEKNSGLNIEEENNLDMTNEGQAADSFTPPASPLMPASSSSTPDGGSGVSEEHPVGSMVWGKLPGYEWWPGVIISYSRDKEGDSATGEVVDGGGVQVWVKWYGENNLSQIPTDKVALFSNFAEHFNAHSLKGLYKRGVFMAIKEAARRCKVEFQCRAEDKVPRWMITDGSSEPTPITGREEEGEKQEGEGRESEKTAERKEPKPGGKQRRRRGGKGDKGGILLNAQEQELLKWALHGFLPAGSMGLVPTSEQDVVVQVIPVQSGGRKGEEGKEGGGSGRGERGRGGEEEEPPKKKAKVMLLQVRKKAHFESVSEGKMKITDVCIACGALDVYTDHPLFEGGLCEECKDTFLECTYLFDEDGTQMYCCICSAGEEVFICDAENCAKVYCGPCISKLCGAMELDRVKAASQWQCYMCSPEFHIVGLLRRREDWDRKLQDLFLDDHKTEYPSPRTYPPITPEYRNPIRVLGLFDGIGTGLLVLKELGIDVEAYVASEVDLDAIKVSRVWHHEIFHIGDISKISETDIEALGPFDLVIGGSPCNDLSIVNPARKGIYEGTGKLFFEFFRIMSYVRLFHDNEKPLFWLYENVVSMRSNDKQTMSRFLRCNPVVVDAKDISATHRARYFWGNIPGMYRPTTPLPGDRLTLQDCLEPNCSRYAQFNKLRTITTKMNSIKQTKAAIYPVRMAPLVGGPEQSDLLKDHMQGDVLWCTEMERLFGFPDHYTDVANLGRSGRQRLLGKAWSVPVLRHLFSPLKDYFRSNTTRDHKMTAVNHNSSNK